MDKDNATSITYHMKIGTECARYFEAWMNQQTKLGDEQARDGVVLPDPVPLHASSFTHNS